MFRKFKPYPLSIALRFWMYLFIPFLFVSCNKATDGELLTRLDTSIVQEQDDWQIRTLRTFSKLVERDNIQIKTPLYVDKFTKIATMWTDVYGYWNTDIGSGRIQIMEYILNNLDSQALLTSFGDIIKGISKDLRKKTLALSVKYKINGYESFYCSILSEQNDKYIAEDFLYSGSEILFYAGKKWIEDRPNVLDSLVYECAVCYNDEGELVYEEKYNGLFEMLTFFSGDNIISSLERNIYYPEIRTRTLLLSNKLGIPGTDERLIKIIDDKLIAGDYLFSGNDVLSKAGAQWIESRPNEIDSYVYECSSCLNEEAEWIDAEKGRKFYYILKTINGNVVVSSLERHVYKSNIRLRALYLGVKLGISGTEERLINILMKHGNSDMAEDFLNSGSSELYDGGQRWANENGYMMMTGMGSNRVSWGNF